MNLVANSYLCLRRFIFLCVRTYRALDAIMKVVVATSHTDVACYPDPDMKRVGNRRTFDEGLSIIYSFNYLLNYFMFV